MKWSDIPTASAVVVLHDPDGAQPVLDASGSLSGSVAHRLDYDGRQGKWEEQGGVDRSVTDDDLRMAERSGLSESVSAQLDYVARMYGFADKGAGSMTDCTYWGQSGPLTREQIENEMFVSGGTFLKSVISVDRRYASELGLDSKEAFQRLMRDEWVGNVMKWGVVSDPSQVRWFANYHDDAQNSLHVHVTTFFSGAAPEPGWTVSAAATRAGKVGIFRSAYSRLMLERDREQDYLRDRIQAIARVETGQELPRDLADRLVSKAESLGFDPEVVRTESRSLDSAADACIERMREEYSAGTGRISSNWKLIAASRDLCDVLYRESSQYREAYDAYRLTIEAKADLRGLAVSDARGHDPSFASAEPTASQKVTMHERDAFIRSEMDDMKKRVATTLVRTCVPEVARDAQVRREAQEAVRGALLGSMRLHGENPTGLSREEAREVVSLLRDSPGNAEIARAAEVIASSPLVSRRLDAAADRIMESRDPGFSDRGEALRALRDSASATLVRYATWQTSRDRFDADALAARGLSRDIVEGRRMSLVQAGLRDGGARLGLPKSEHAALVECVAEIRRTLASGEPDRAALDRAVDIIVSSPTVQRAVERHAAPFDADGSTHAREAALSSVRGAVQAQLAGGHFHLDRQKPQLPLDPQMQRDMPAEMQLPGDQLNLSNLGSFLSQAAKGAMRTGTSGMTRPRRRVNEQAESITPPRGK